MAQQSTIGHACGGRSHNEQNTTLRECCKAIEVEQKSKMVPNDFMLTGKPVSRSPLHLISGVHSGWRLVEVSTNEAGAPYGESQVQHVTVRPQFMVSTRPCIIMSCSIERWEKRWHAQSAKACLINKDTCRIQNKWRSMRLATPCLGASSVGSRGGFNPLMIVLCWSCLLANGLAWISRVAVKNNVEFSFVDDRGDDQCSCEWVLMWEAAHRHSAVERKTFSRDRELQ